MKFRLAGLMSWVVLCSCVLTQAVPGISISTDRPEAVYAVGDTVVFRVEVTDEEQALGPIEVTGELSSDGFRHTEVVPVHVTEGKAQVPGRLDNPGLLWLRVTLKQVNAKPVRKEMGAAFSPEKIEPSLPKPADFDAFWQSQKDRVNAIPMGAVLTQVDSPEAGVELYTVTLNNIDDTKIYGYLARPTGDGPFPAYLQVQWAGVYFLDPAWTLWIAKMGFITLDINAHAIENGRPQTYYDALSRGELKDYAYQGRDSRETSYFLRMYLSCYRAAEYLVSRPEWDRTHFVVAGGSQGGGQTLVTAGLSPHVTALAADVPALCDLTGNVVGRFDGWPRMVTLDAQGVAVPEQQETARYFDAVNFVREVKVPAIVGTGFADLVCPSSSVYAAFNVLKGPKTMVVDPKTGHNGGKVNWQKAYNAFLREQGGIGSR
ncbi:MAG: acetylxylan esterase [Phycisphaerae bacterium]|nr:acetylxylan esterase [Phycisphaerae bacterium]